MFISGLVGANFGSIANCTNEAVSLGTIVQQLDMTILYSGIASFNDSGTMDGVSSTGVIFNCANNADVSLTLSKGTIYMGGIVIKNAGTISACANYGNLSCRATTTNGGTFYIGGIALNSTGGTFNYCVNSGNLTFTNATRKMVGGIVLSYNHGTTRGVVDTAGNTLTAYCGSVSNSNAYVRENVSVDTLLTSTTKSLSTNETISGNVAFRGTIYKITISVVNYVPTMTVVKA